MAPQQANNTFHLFPLLPDEIRLMIWRSAFIPQRFTINEYNYFSDTTEYYRHPAQAQWLSPQTLLLVNKEAHDEFKSAYEPFYETLPTYYWEPRTQRELPQKYEKPMKRKRYINKSLDTICIPDAAFDSWPEEEPSSRLTGIKYLEFDYGTWDLGELLWSRQCWDTYSSTDPSFRNEWIPDFRPLRNSLEMVTLRPLYSRFGRRGGDRENGWVYEPPEDGIKEEDRFTNANLPYHHNNNMHYMCEALAFAMGMGKDLTHYQGPKIVVILATDPNTRDSSYNSDPHYRPYRLDYSEATWKLPDMNGWYTKCNFDKPSPSTWARLKATQPDEYLRSAKEVDAGGTGLWCIREVVGFDIDKEVKENPMLSPYPE